MQEHGGKLRSRQSSGREQRVESDRREIENLRERRGQSFGPRGALAAVLACRDHGELRRDFHENVVDVLDELRTVAQQFMTTLAERVMNGPGHGEHLASVFRGEPCRNERAAPACRLDDERAQAESRDDAIAQRKLERADGMPRRIFRNDEASSPDGLGELAIACRIDAVDAPARDRDGVAPAVESAAMARRVDAGRETARDDEPEAADLECEGLRRYLAVAARVPAADDRELRFGEEG